MPAHSNDHVRRVGLVGYGLAGSVFHAPLVAATPGLELAAVVTTSDERAARARHDHPGARVVADAERLWDGRDGDPVDLVVVASPNRTHVPLARAAVDAGRHVVVDKPVAPTAEEARELGGRARERGVLLVPFHNRRWDGDFLTVRRLLDEGALGDVWRFASRFDRWRPEVRTGDRAWKERGAPGDATGVLYDLGTHLVDQALVLFGPARLVYAELDLRRAGAAVDDDAFVAITHASSVRTHLHASLVSARPGPRFHVSGARAAYVVGGVDPQEAALAAGARPGDAGWGESPPDRWGSLGAEDGGEVRPVPTERGAYERYYARVRDALLGRAAPPVAWDDAVAGLAVLDAARRSAGGEGAVAVGNAALGARDVRARPPGPA